MEKVCKGIKQENFSSTTKTTPGKSTFDLPPYEEMVNQLLKNRAMTEEDIRTLYYIEAFD